MKLVLFLNSTSKFLQMSHCNYNLNICMTNRKSIVYKEPNIIVKFFFRISRFHYKSFIYSSGKTILCILKNRLHFSINMAMAVKHSQFGSSH